jgi:hypothetical protein
LKSSLKGAVPLKLIALKGPKAAEKEPEGT